MALLTFNHFGTNFGSFPILTISFICSCKSASVSSSNLCTWKIKENCSKGSIKLFPSLILLIRNAIYFSHCAPNVSVCVVTSHKKYWFFATCNNFRFFSSLFWFTDNIYERDKCCTMPVAICKRKFLLFEKVGVEFDATGNLYGFSVVLCT